MVRVVVSDPESGRAYQIESEESNVGRLMGLQIGQTFDGDTIGLPGYKLLITGGTDKDGFPMRSDARGPGRSRVVLSKGPGYKPREEGTRRRKLLRGRVISRDIAQLNVKVIERGGKDIQEILAPEPTLEEAEGGVEEKTPEEPEEKPEEEEEKAEGEEEEEEEAKGESEPEEGLEEPGEEGEEEEESGEASEKGKSEEP